MFALTDGLIYGAVLAALVFLYALARTSNANCSIWAAVSALFSAMLVVWFCEYVLNVSHTGYLGGYGYVVIAFAVGLLCAQWSLSGQNESSGDSSGSLPSILALFLVVGLVGGYIVTYFYCAVGTTNNARWAALANVTTAKQAEKPVLPDTDANEMLVMDVHLAYTRAHSELGRGGNNLGSRYEVYEDEGVQQWYNGRNWFVFPLELNGWSEQEGFLTKQIECGAGYIAVPADDENGDVKIQSGLCLKYLPHSYFSLNLIRYVYSHGYSDGDLIDPTMELDEDGHPYFTIAYTQPAFVVGGSQVVKILVVDPATGKIDEYAPADLPEWVDRVNSVSMVTDWLGDFAKHGKVPDYFNSNGNGQNKIDTIRLVNTHGQHQVFQVPLLANNDKAISTTGIVLYDPRKAEGTLYEAEGASGLASYATLKAAFENITQNTRGWHVEHIQWYAIQGVPTWMAIYAKEVDLKDGQKQTVYAGVGFLDARNSNTGEVKFGSTKREALEAYYDYLSTRSVNGEQVDESVTTKTLNGVVLRVGPAAMVNNQSSYTLVLNGDARVFIASHSINAILPVIKEGDSVVLTFDESAKPNGNRRQVKTIVDTTLDELMKSH